MIPAKNADHYCIWGYIIDLGEYDLNYYFCDSCRYCLSAEKLPDWCLDCGAQIYKEKSAVRLASNNEIEELLWIRAYPFLPSRAATLPVLFPWSLQLSRNYVFLYRAVLCVTLVDQIKKVLHRWEILRFCSLQVLLLHFLQFSIILPSFPTEIHILSYGTYYRGLLHIATSFLTSFN